MNRRTASEDEGAALFESLTDKLQGAFRKFGSRGVVNEEDLDQALREVRMAMLEADVNFRVVREFTARVREKALGAQVLRSLTPAQQVIGIVHEELVDLLGGEPPQLATAPRPPSVIMVVGLQGSGKTTSIAKLANLLKKEGQRPLVIACDVYRPAAIDQLVTLAKQLDIPYHEEGADQPPAKIAANGLEKARRMGCTHVLVDTAGRLHIDEAMMTEVADLRQQLAPQEVLFVADAMAGQDAVTAAKEFHEKVGITGLVLTKMDGDARGGAALSIRHVIGVPVKFVGVGEKAEALETFHPDRMAGRILGMGDMMTLVEKARIEMGDEDTDKFGEKFKKGTFDLQDFLEQLRKVRRMGPLGQLVQIRRGTPTTLNRLMAEGRLDLSPVSSVAAAEHAEEWLVVDDLCIGCRGEVGSVILHSDRPVEELDGASIAVTNASATAAKLLEVLLARHWRVTAELLPQETPVGPRLLIGDAALKTAQSSLPGFVYDLGQEWRNFTGGDFVFGLWCVRREFAREHPEETWALYHLLQTSYALGRVGTVGVIAEASQVTGLSIPVVTDYFRKLVYELDGRLWAGLTEFLRLLGYGSNRLEKFGIGSD